MGFPESLTSNDSVELCIFKAFFRMEAFPLLRIACVQK